MEKLKRNGRMSAITRILTESPNHIHTLNEFCAMFDAAKSTISEDIELVREVFEQFGLGRIETVTGAAGGVRYLPGLPAVEALKRVHAIARTLQSPDRVLPGGFLYMADLLSNPPLLDPLAVTLAEQFLQQEPDFVLTVETTGIPLAASIARYCGTPLVIARRDHKAYEGTRVSINFVSGSTGQLQTMSLARRTVQPGQRALIIDDFMKAGGTMRGMMDLMREFSIQVVGAGVLACMRYDAQPDSILSLMTIESIDEQRGAVVSPAKWLVDAASKE